MSNVPEVEGVDRASFFALFLTEFADWWDSRNFIWGKSTETNLKEVNKNPRMALTEMLFEKEQPFFMFVRMSSMKTLFCNGIL